MTTGQNYVGKASYAKNLEQTASTHTSAAQTAAQTSSTADHRQPAPLIISGEFVDLMRDPIIVNYFRRDVRAWFMAYLSESDEVVADPTSLKQSTDNFQALDDFFSTLIEEGISRLKGGKGHE